MRKLNGVAALQPGHARQWLLRHRHGLCQQVEFDRPGAAARDHHRLASDRYGAVDPSDGGNTNRFSLSAASAQSDDVGSWKANAYVVKSQLDLFNNFTYLPRDPVSATSSTSTTTA